MERINVNYRLCVICNCDSFDLFAATIFVHELGHFIAARFCGMVVETFSIGFGPALWRRKFRAHGIKIGALQLGYYVALPQ